MVDDQAENGPAATKASAPRKASRGTVAARSGAAGGTQQRRSSSSTSKTKNGASTTAARQPVRVTKVVRPGGGPKNRQNSVPSGTDGTPELRPAAIMASDGVHGGYDHDDDDDDDDEFAVAARLARQQHASRANGGAAGAHAAAQHDAQGVHDDRTAELLAEIQALDAAIDKARNEETASVREIAAERERAQNQGVTSPAGVTRRARGAGAEKAMSRSTFDPTNPDRYPQSSKEGTTSPSGRGKSSGGGLSSIGRTLFGGDDDGDDSDDDTAGHGATKGHGVGGKGSSSPSYGRAPQASHLQTLKKVHGEVEGSSHLDTVSEISVARSKNMGHRDIFGADEEPQEKPSSLMSSRRHLEGSYRSEFDLGAGDEEGVKCVRIVCDGG